MATEIQYLTPVEAGEYLRSTPSTLSKLRLNGKGPSFVRIGKAVRYRKQDLDEWMSASSNAPLKYRQGKR